MFTVSVSKNSAITFAQYTSVFAKNKSKYRSLKNLLKLKNLVDIGGVSLSVTIGLENFTDDVGGDLTISGICKMWAISINFAPLIPKILMQTFSSSFFLGLGGKGLYILDSIMSKAWW